METAYVYPVGSSLCMEDFRNLTPEQRVLFADSYYMGFVSILAYVSGLLDRAGAAPTERAAIVFSDQVEFRHRAVKFFEKAYNEESFIKGRIDPPTFRDMIVEESYLHAHGAVDGAERSAEDHHATLTSAPARS